MLPQLISPLPQLLASNLELLSLSVIDCLQGKKKSRSRMVFAEGKDLVVSVMSAMGEEQICALKDIGSK
ncbi:hypothetical protein ES332_D03G173000v1 [Gossypium tomentosum]|uniref:Translation initiation factor 5A C-terminal domain-containing protein n=1 Tax=Gossypium tomentosum TaxID=34277 RepID=A0A5D2LR00_GOSTO|nr:hypothetical protein ES332_D03G173000v1 [Gossypium tomentosum]